MIFEISDIQLLSGFSFDHKHTCLVAETVAHSRQGYAFSNHPTVLRNILPCQGLSCPLFIFLVRKSTCRRKVEVGSEWNYSDPPPSVRPSRGRKGLRCGAIHIRCPQSFGVSLLPTPTLSTFHKHNLSVLLVHQIFLLSPLNADVICEGPLLLLWRRQEAILSAGHL